jgi:glycerol kinase
MPELLLALDVGTTSARAMLISPAGAVLGIEKRLIVAFYPGPGRVEQDGAAIWTAVIGAADTLFSAAGRSAADVAAIGVTTQRAGAVVWDRATSEPLAPVIVWSDVGNAARSREISAAGFPSWPQLPSAKLEALLDRVDDGRGRAARGEILFGPIDSWLVQKLSGGGAHLTDFSGAWFTGYLDYATGSRWNAGLLDFQGLPDAFLPRIVDSWGPLAQTAPDVFGRAIPITALIADQQAGMIAHNAIGRGAWKATYGTSAVLMASLGETLSATHRAMPPAAMLRADSVAHFCVEGMVISAGAVIEWLCGPMRMFASPADFAAAAARGRPDSGVMLVPALQGLGAPHSRLDARGSLTGLSPETTPEDIAAATLTAIACRIREIAEALPDAVRATLPVDGGLTADPGFLQRQADILGLPVRRHAVREATAYGAAIAAGLGAGLIGADTLAVFARYDLDLAPAISRDEADALFHRWQTARALAHG